MTLFLIFIVISVFATSTILLLKNKLYNYTYAVLVVSLLAFLLLLDVRTRILDIALGNVRLTLSEIKVATDEATELMNTVRSNAYVQAKVIIPTFYVVPTDNYITMLMAIIDGNGRQKELLNNLSSLGISSEDMNELNRMGLESAISQLRIAILKRVYPGKNRPNESSVGEAFGKWFTRLGVDTSELISVIENIDNAGNIYSEELGILRLLSAFESAYAADSLEIAPYYTPLINANTNMHIHNEKYQR